MASGTASVAGFGSRRGDWYPGRMTVLEHVYGVPSEDELAMLVGAATPHFAMQIHARVASYARQLPDTHPRQPELRRHLSRLEEIARHGEHGGQATPDLPPHGSLNA